MKSFYIAIKDANFTKRFHNNEKKVSSGNRIMIDFLYNTYDPGNRATHKRRKLL